MEKDYTNIDAFEYDLIGKFEDHDGNRFEEPIDPDELDNPSDPRMTDAFYSVFGHLESGGRICLVDLDRFPTNIGLELAVLITENLNGVFND